MSTTPASTDKQAKLVPDVLPEPFHPLANMFPLMEGAEFDELVADIKQNGLRERIELYQGKILDGRNRYRALQRLGINPIGRAEYCCRITGHLIEARNDEQARAYVISKNLHRRHLTAEQKRDVIAALLNADRTQTDRSIAKVAKVSPHTVASVRREGEPNVQNAHKTRVEASGRKARGRKPGEQPAKKPPPAPTPAPAPAPEPSVKAKVPEPHLAPFQIDPELQAALDEQQKLNARPAPATKQYSKRLLERVVETVRYAARDFAAYTIMNIDSGHLKLTGDPERMRKWRDLKERVEPLIQGAGK
jgi:hypothetical protein